MKRYIKSSKQTYYRIDHKGSRDRDEHFGSTSIKDIIDKLNEFGLPTELAEFDSGFRPEYITTNILSTGTVVNTWEGWEVSKRDL